MIYEPHPVETPAVGSLSPDDRTLLAYITAAQILTNAPPSRESLPLLSDIEHAHLVDVLRGIAHDMREAGGERGLDLYRAVQ